MSAQYTTLLIMFGGQGGALGMQPFEFVKMTQGFPTKRLFARDLNRAWYHRGITGRGGTIPETAESLHELVGENDVDRLVVTGVSGGGFAALAFGALLGAHEALAFSPQTVLDLDVLASFDDHRFDRRLKELAKTGGMDPGWTDLRAALPGARRGATRFHVHFDRTFDRDRIHAERVGEVEGVELHGHEGGGHNIARSLRNRGELKPLLMRLIGTPGESA